MPILSGEVSVAANAVSANVLSGELFEFLPRTTAIAVYLTMSATGLTASFSIGGEQQAEDQRFNIRASPPVVPDDLFLRAGGRRGERLFLRFRNQTVGALTARWLIQIA